MPENMKTDSPNEIETIREYFTKLRTKIKTFERQYESKNNGAKPDTNKIKSNFKLYSSYQKYWHLKKLLLSFDSEEKKIDIDELIRDWSKFCKKLKLKAQQQQNEKEQEEKENSLKKAESRLQQKHISKSEDGTKSMERTPRKRKATQIPTSLSTTSPSKLVAGNDSDASSQEEEEEVDENIVIGPTPQLNGRVLSVFDIKFSPEKTPLSTPKSKSKSNSLLPNLQNQNEESVEFKTPSKKPVQRKLTFTNDHNDEDSEFKTPSKNMTARLNRVEIEATPAYLRTESFASSQQMSNFEINDSDNGNDGSISWSDVDSDEVNELQMSFGDFKNVDRSENKGLDIVSPSKFIEPSPILRKIRGKSLFKMNEELHELRRTLKFDELDKIEDDKKEKVGGEDAKDGKDFVSAEKELMKVEKNEPETLEEMIKNNEETDKELNSLDEDRGKFEENDPSRKYRKKVKTIKRTTRRVKLKTSELDNEDQLEDVDVHKQIRKLEKENQKRSIDNIDDDSEEDDRESEKEEDEYKRRDFKDLKKHTKENQGKHPLSNNFVRMKIHYKNRGKKFQRRR